MSCRIDRALASLVLLGLAGCTTPQYGRTPFRCSASDAGAACPTGYRCLSNLCVANDQPASIVLSSEIVDGEDSFQLLARANDAIFCWTRAPQSGAVAIEYSVVRPDGTYSVAPQTLWSADDSASLINGASGACALRGDQIALGTIQWVNSTALAFASSSIDPASRARTLFAPTVQTFADERPSHFGPAVVGAENWFLFSSLSTTALDESHQFDLVTVGADNVQHYVTTGLKPPLMSQQVETIEALPGTGGAWAFAALTGGEARIAWIDQAADHTVAQLWAAPPVPVGGYDAVAPLGVTGNQLAIAYRIEATTWQLYWVTPGGTTPDPVQFAPSTVVMGPQLTETSNLVRPGGYVDGGELIIADADDTQHVIVRAVPWGQTTVQQRASFTKLSSIAPLRMQIARIAGQYAVAWTERIPGTENTSYITLNSVFIPVPTGS